MITKTVKTKAGLHNNEVTLEEITVIYKIFGISIYKKHIELPSKQDVVAWNIPFPIKAI